MPEAQALIIEPEQELKFKGEFELVDLLLFVRSYNKEDLSCFRSFHSCDYITSKTN